MANKKRPELNRTRRYPCARRLEAQEHKNRPRDFFLFLGGEMSKDPTCHVRGNLAQILAVYAKMAFSEERRENLPLRQFVDTAQSIAREHIREGKLQIELDKLRQSNPNGWGNGK